MPDTGSPGYGGPATDEPEIINVLGGLGLSIRMTSLKGQENSSRPRVSVTKGSGSQSCGSPTAVGVSRTAFAGYDRFQPGALALAVTHH